MLLCQVFQGDLHQVSIYKCHHKLTVIIKEVSLR